MLLDENGALLDEGGTLLLENGALLDEKGWLLLDTPELLLGIALDDEGTGALELETSLLENAAELLLKGEEDAEEIEVWNDDEDIADDKELAEDDEPLLDEENDFG